MRLYGVTGWKNSGKTGLMERLVAEITARGFTVSTVKHAHHSFDVDQPGKDSHRHRLAGATQVLLASRNRVALMTELRDAEEPPLEVLLAQLAPCDLVLVEGYKRDRHPKIEAQRAATGQPLIAPDDPTIRAVASDAAPALDRPVFHLDDTKVVADFILQEVGLAAPEAAVAATALDPPPLSNDCFALPPGVDWVPVDEALTHLRNTLAVRVGTEQAPLEGAEGRILAQDMVARRSNPPQANAAVDGYGFAGALPEGVARLPLVEGRAAAGVPFDSVVPEGHALRILTGAALPAGVDTVALQEDVTTDGRQIVLRGPLKRGANARKAGEDVAEGATVLSAGRRLTPADLALLAAVGHGTLPLRRRLRVGVLSTGDEILAPGAQAGTGQIFDANRPMLLALARQWGFEAVDLGIAPDDRTALRALLDDAASATDVVLTSGGASAGDEDHMSALLREAGAMQLWRIAVKPGRPLALGTWRGVPVFGLPGNPVAALVCTLIFARPALEVLAGGSWFTPQGFELPAGFAKRKKPGRREYLRARMRDGRAEVFASEGSGRISGLSWAEGLVELPDGPAQIAEGDPVRFLPLGSFSG